MARKRPTPAEEPPPASSSEQVESSSGEEEEEEEEVSSSGEEEEQQTQTKTQKPPPQTQPTKPAQNKQTESDSGSETGSGSESESQSQSESESDSDSVLPNNAPIATVKPIASKPMEETPTKNKKPRSKARAPTSPPAKSTAAPVSPPAKSTAAKRGSETDRDVKDSKRAKKKDSEADGVAEKSEDTKKQLFQRVWSPEDEIAVLEGILKFTEQKGFDPAKDMNAFFDFIKKSLHCDVSLAQLKDKVWRLKKKFANGKNYSKPHDQKASDLANKIWGREGTNGGAGESSVKSNGKAKKSVNSKNLEEVKASLALVVPKQEGETRGIETEKSSVPKEKINISAGFRSTEDFVVSEGMDMLEESNRVEMEEKWKKLQLAELEVYLQRIELLREQTKLILAAYRTQG